MTGAARANWGAIEVAITSPITNLTRGCDRRGWAFAMLAQYRREQRYACGGQFTPLGVEVAERMLSDPTAQEWMVNTPTRVFRDNGQRIERIHDLRFEDDRQVRAFLDRLLESVEGKRLDRITPRIEARLPDGSRLTAAIPPVSSNGHVICSIRRFKLAAESNMLANPNDPHTATVFDPSIKGHTDKLLFKFVKP